MSQGPQRAGGLLRTLLAARGAGALNFVAAQQVPSSLAALAAPLITQAARRYSSWEGHWTSPRRSQAYRELAAVRSLLPHRSSLVAQFSPHGVSLVPETLLLLQHQPIVLQRDDDEYEEGAGCTGAEASAAAEAAADLANNNTDDPAAPDLAATADGGRRRTGAQGKRFMRAVQGQKRD